MRLHALALAVLLSLAGVGAAAYAPTSNDKSENYAERRAEGLVPTGQEANAIVAVITEIDRQNGVVSLDTEIGPIITFAAPEDLQGLRTGDQIVLYVIDEDPQQNLPQDIIIA